MRARPPSQVPQICGVWVISDARTSRQGFTRKLFKEFTAPLLGARIHVYTQDVARIVLRSGQESLGYVFTAGLDSSVTFWFVDSVAGLDQVAFPWCQFKGTDHLVCDDGTNTFSFSRRDTEPGSMDGMDAIVVDRQSVTLKELLDKAATRPSTTSSDGKAFLPGVQGIGDPPSIKDNGSVAGDVRKINEK